MAGKNTVQTVGNLTISFVHPLILGATAVTLKGFKLEGDLLDTAQLMDNSKIIALIGGDTATITNNVRAGTLTLNAVETSGDAAQGDVVALSNLLQATPDSVGGTITVSRSVNGATKSITLLGVTHKSHPPIKMSGNDLPTYVCTFNYADYV